MLNRVEKVSRRNNVFPRCIKKRKKRFGQVIRHEGSDVYSISTCDVYIACIIKSLYNFVSRYGRCSKITLTFIISERRFPSRLKIHSSETRHSVSTLNIDGSLTSLGGGARTESLTGWPSRAVRQTDFTTLLSFADRFRTRNPRFSSAVSKPPPYPLLLLSLASSLREHVRLTPLPLPKAVVAGKRKPWRKGMRRMWLCISALFHLLPVPLEFFGSLRHPIRNSPNSPSARKCVSWRERVSLARRLLSSPSPPPLARRVHLSCIYLHDPQLCLDLLETKAPQFRRKIISL